MKKTKLDSLPQNNLGSVCEGRPDFSMTCYVILGQCIFDINNGMQMGYKKKGR